MLQYQLTASRLGTFVVCAKYHVSAWNTPLPPQENPSWLYKAKAQERAGMYGTSGEALEFWKIRYVATAGNAVSSLAEEEGRGGAWVAVQYGR